jgi:hypothetical protein
MGTKAHSVHFDTDQGVQGQTGKRMPHRYNEKARLELTRFRDIALQFQNAVEASQNFLHNAGDLGDQTRARFRRRGEEARFLSMQVSDDFTQRLLLELAEEFDSLAR